MFLTANTWIQLKCPLVQENLNMIHHRIGYYAAIKINEVFINKELVYI